MFLLLKYQKTFDLFGQKSKKKSCHVFVCAFIWNHPYTRCINNIFRIFEEPTLKKLDGVSPDDNRPSIN